MTAAGCTSAETRAVRLVVTGRVQGVFYRASTRERGERLGLAGWVRNRSDGSVEVHAQGPPALVDALVDWCRQGPPHAAVDGVACSQAEVDPALSKFGIRP